MVVVIVQMILSCSTSKKSDSFVGPTNRKMVVTDTLVKANTLVLIDTHIVADTIVEQQAEKPKNPVSFIDSITLQYDSLLGDSQQLLLVYNNKATSITSELRAYELGGEGWVAVDSLAGPCNIGRKGFAAYGKKIEGDGKTPTGIYSVTHFFSKDPDFSANLEKITVLQNTIWVDDPEDSLYNKYCEQSATHPRKGEKLIRKDAQYDYVLVINYNTAERKPYMGSAIFFHVWSHQGGCTAGCVAVDKKHILKIISWIDAAKHPKIVMGSLENNGIFHIEGTKYQ